MSRLQANKLLALFMAACILLSMVTSVPVYGAGSPGISIVQGESTELEVDENSEAVLQLSAEGDEGSNIGWHIFTQADNGTATVTGAVYGSSQTIAYVPREGYVGEDRFVVEAGSEQAGSATITVNVTVNPVSDAPENLERPSISGEPCRGSELTADPGSWTEPDEQETISYAYQWQRASDSLGTDTEDIPEAAGNTYIPGVSDMGKYIRVEVTATYGTEGAPGAQSITACSVWTLIEANHRPVILEESPSVTVPENSDGTDFNLTLHASDSDGDILTWSIETAALHGNAGVAVPNTGTSQAISYSPVEEYSGTDSFVVQVSDGLGGTDNITVNVYIVPGNDAPVITEGAEKTVSMSEDGNPTAFDLTLNATDPDEDTLTWSIETAALHGNAGVEAPNTGTSQAISYVPAANYNGTDSFVVRVSDGQGGTDSITVTVNIDASNDAPVIAEGAARAVSMSEDGNPTAFDLTLHATDADEDDILTWSIKTAAAHGTAAVSSTPTGTSQVISYTPAADYNGTDSFVVQVSDETTSAAITINVSISAVNDTPVFTKGNDISVQEDSGAFTQTGWATGISAGAPDESAQVLAFNVSNTDNTLFSVQPGISPNGTLTFTPAANANGNATVSVSLSDGNLISEVQSFVISVNPLNDIPSFTKGANQGCAEDAPSQSVANWATAISRGPADEDDQTLEFVLSNNNNALFSEQPAVTPDGTLSYKPAKDANGIALVTITAKDYGGASEALEAASAPQTFTIEVSPVNDAPTISEIEDQSDVEDAVLPKVVTFTVDDVDNTVSLLSIAATSDNAGLLPDSSIVISGTGSSRSLSMVPLENQYGVANITVAVSDGTSTVYEYFKLDIASMNDLPTITSIANQAINEDGSTGNILFNIGDVETAAAALGVTAVSDDTTLFPGTLTIGGSGASRSINLSPAENLSGSAQITITVTDADGGFRNVAFTVTVNAVNDLPTLTLPGTVTIAEDTVTGELGITVGDVETTDAAALDVSAVSTNTNLIPDDNISLGGSGTSRTIQLTPLRDQNGSAVITVTVKDTDGGTTVKSFQVKVTPVNDTPTITPPAAQSINEDIEISSEFQFTVDDIDNNPADLNVTAASGNTGLIPDTNIILGGSGTTRSIKVIPTEDNNGTAEITLRVSDGSLSATDKFVVTVDNVNDAPYIGTIADQEIAMNTQTQAIAFNVHDIDNDAAGLTLSYSSNNQELVPSTDTNIVLGGSGANRTVKVIPAADKTGTATITVTVSDGELTASESFTVYVDGTGGGPSVISNIRDQVINEDTDTGYIYFSVDSAYTMVNVTAGDESIFPAGNIEKGSEGTEAARTVWYTKLRPIENANGEAIITVSADNGTETKTRTFKITVTPVNDLPVINGNPFIQMTEDGSTQENSSITVNDVDGDDLNVSVNATNLVLFPSGAVEAVGHGSSWTLSITPAKDRNGVSVITVTVDDRHETVKENFIVNVAAENDAPTITGIAAQAIEEDSTLGSLSFDVGDVELTSDSLSVWATSSNQALVPDGNITIGGRGATRTISLQPAANANTEVKGTATITVHVSDGALSAETSFLLTVAPVNDAPYINYIANQTILEDADTGELAFTIGDIDTDTSKVTISATSSNTDLIPAAGISTGGTGSSRTICLTPAANAYGSTVITVKASDGVPGGTSSRTFTLNVVSVNDAPVVTVNSTINIDEDTSTETPVPFSISDVETPAASLVLSVSSGNEILLPNSGIALEGSGADWSMSLTPAANQNGVMLVPIKVSDGTATTIKNVTLVVNPINDKPTITAIADQTIDEDSAGVTLGFTVGDIETSAGSLVVTASSGNTSLVSPGNILLGGSGANRTIKLTPIAQQNGVAVITLNVYDGTDTTTETFKLNVTPVNDIPSFTGGGNQVVDEDSGMQTITSWATDIYTGQPNESSQTVTFYVSSDNNPLFDIQPEIRPDGTLTYRPAANANGTATISVYMKDDGGTAHGGVDTTPTQTFTITVNAVNDMPAFVKGADQTFNEDCGAKSVNNWASGISRGPSDESGQTVNFVVSVSADPTLTFSSAPAISPAGVLTFTPAPNSYGTANVTVYIHDNGGTARNGKDSSAGQSFVITINPVNDRPTFTKGANQSFPEDCGAKSISWATGISKGAANESAQTLTFHVTNDNNGLFSAQPSITSTGTLTFKPAPDANGTATVTVYLTDDGGVANGGVDTSTTQTFTITITAVNDTPVMTETGPLEVAMSEDSSPTPFELTLHATDVENSILTWSISGAAAHGMAAVSGAPTGTSQAISYTPNANYNGTDSFVVSVNDGSAAATIRVNVTIAPVNDAPVITQGETATVTVNEDAGDAVILTLDGTDVEDDNLTWSISGASTHGNASVSSTPTGASQAINYMPDANYNGTDSFVVQLSDGNGGIDTILVSVTVDSVNDVPVITEIGPITVTMSEDSSPTPFELTLHAVDVENSILTWSISGAALYGTASVSSTPTGTSQAISYIPNANYNGTDSFVVDVTDGRDSVTITVNVIITPINDAPVITQGEVATVTVNEDAGNTAVLTLGGTDADNDNLTWSISRAALHGTASVSSTPTGTSQEISYIPDADYNGNDSFVVELSDSNGGIDTITVNVTVASINDVPVITESGPVSVTMSEDGIPTPFALTLHAVDVENSTLTWSISGAAIHGTASVSNAPTGTSQVISYIPNVNYNGADSFVVSVTDGMASAAITVNVTITPVNDIPVTSDYDYTIRAGSIVKGRIAASDADGDALSYILQTLPAEIKGNFTLNRTTGEWTFASLLNFAGTQGVRVQVSDGQGGTALSTISFNIRALTISKEYIETTVKNTPVSSRVSMGNSSSYTVSIQPLHGEVGLNNDGSYTYTPAVGYVGTDQFTVLASGGSEPALLLVRIVVNDVNLVLQGTVSRAMEPHGVIGGAQVKLLDLSGKVIKSTVTDENGKYQFTALAENNYKMVVTHPEYSENRRVAEIFQARATDGVITQNFNMAAFTISLSASPSSIKGDGHDTTLLTAVIKDVNGVPVKDVTLSFNAPLGTFDYTDQNTGTAVTGEDGAAGIHYTSADISASNTSITVPVTVSVNDTDKGLFADESIFVTFAPGFITGVVYDSAAHEHVKGAIVEVYKDFDDDGITDFSFTQTTGEDGAYNIAVPKAGVQYEIRITKPVTIGNTTQTVEYTQKATVESVDGQTFTSDLTAAGLIVAEQPDGSQSIVGDFSRLSFEVQDKNGTELNGINGGLDADAGIFHADKLEPDTDYVFVVKYQVAPGQELIVGKMSVNLNLDGEMSISHILIDPYGVVKDQDTGEVIKDAVVTLHYANTARNEEKGTVVRLPKLEDFPPNDNKNPQKTDEHGKYAFMVFPESDYYIVAEKPGYTTYTSPTIAVEHELVQHNFTMKKAPAGGGTGGSGGGGGGAGGSAGAAPNAGVVTVPTVAAQADNEVRDLAVTLNTSRMKVSEGSEVQLTIPFVNKSKVEIHDAVITAYIPDGLQVVSIGDGIADGRAIRWIRTDVKPGSRENLLFTLKADTIDGGELMKEIRVEVTSKENLSLLDDDKSKIQLMVYSNRTSKIHHRYIKGTPDGKFKPESKLTRAETAAIFARLLNLESTVTSKKSLYSDVSGSHWANEYIIAVSQKGLMKGVGSGKFAPDSPISRAELATIIARYFGLERSSSIQPIEQHFSDIGQNWAGSSIEEIYRYSIIKGYNDGTFRPDSSITRAEAVACFNRMLYRGPISNVGNVFPDVKQSFWAAGDIDEAYNSHEYIINPDGTEKVIRYIEEPLW